MTKATYTKDVPAIPSMLQGTGIPTQPNPIPASPFANFANRGTPGMRDEALRGRFGEGIRGNRVTILGRRMIELSIDRPSVLVPLGIVTGIIYYQTMERPPWQNLAAAAPSTLTNFTGFKSSGHGVCILPTIGTWFLYYDVVVGQTVEFIVYPAEDPGIETKFLAEPGCHTANSIQVSAAINTAATIAANRDRKALELQNNSGGTTIVRLGFTNAPAVGIPPAGSGLALNTGDTYKISGDTCYKGIVNLIGNGAWLVDAIEYV